ncbi:hypothetical protein J1N35_043410 [Gossypium stocksii]|uniref:Uncharacterized protein n=1 Tax=Gossypium stocksii TaxID=47602 RepID=A0A9D3ZF19_9ROSI|nr:hypothetical protein J1N35_043410 [Gossypium stocksii]
MMSPRRGVRGHGKGRVRAGSLASGHTSAGEAPTSPEHEMLQETEVRVSLPTSSSGNLELGTNVLTQLVREVLEEVKEIGETLQVRSVDCKKKEITFSRAVVSFYEAC